MDQNPWILGMSSLTRLAVIAGFFTVIAGFFTVIAWSITCLTICRGFQTAPVGRFRRTLGLYSFSRNDGQEK
jgi:hypothetical protein